MEKREIQKPYFNMNQFFSLNLSEVIDQRSLTKPSERQKLNIKVETYFGRDYLVVLSKSKLIDDQLGLRSTATIFLFEIEENHNRKGGFPKYTRKTFIDVISHLWAINQTKISYQRASDNLIITPKTKRICLALSRPLSEDLKDGSESMHRNINSYTRTVIPGEGMEEDEDENHFDTKDLIDLVVIAFNTRSQLKIEKILRLSINCLLSSLNSTLDIESFYLSCSQDEINFYVSDSEISKFIHVLQDSPYGHNKVEYVYDEAAVVRLPQEKINTYGLERAEIYSKLIIKYEQAQKILLIEEDIVERGIGKFGSRIINQDNVLLFYDLMDGEAVKKYLKSHMLRRSHTLGQHSHNPNQEALLNEDTGNLDHYHTHRASIHRSSIIQEKDTNYRQLRVVKTAWAHKTILAVTINNFKTNSFKLKLMEFEEHNTRTSQVDVELRVDIHKIYSGLYGKDLLQLKIHPERQDPLTGEDLVKFHIATDLSAIYVTGFSMVKAKSGGSQYLGEGSERIERSDISAVFVFKNSNIVDFSTEGSDQNISKVLKFKQVHEPFFYIGKVKDVKFALNCRHPLFLVQNENSGFYLYTIDYEGEWRWEQHRNFGRKKIQGKQIKPKKRKKKGAGGVGIPDFENRVKHKTCNIIQFFKKESRALNQAKGRSLTTKTRLEIDPDGDFVVLKYSLGAVNKQLLSNSVIEVWKRANSKYKDSEQARLEGAIGEEEDPFVNAQIIKIIELIKKSQSNEPRSAFLMCKQNKSMIINEDLYRLVNRKSTLRYIKLQENPHFKSLVKMELSSDSKFMFTVGNLAVNDRETEEGTKKVFEKEYSIWVVNEDQTLSQTENLRTSLSNYVMSNNFQSMVRLKKDLSPAQLVLRRPSDFSSSLPWKFMVNLIKGLKIQKGDTQQVRKINITSVDTYIREEFPEAYERSIRVEVPPNQFSAAMGKGDQEYLYFYGPLIEDIDKSSLRMVQKVHEQYNLLYLVIAAKNHVLLESALERYNYHPFFYKRGFDPLNAALELKHDQTLRAIANFLSEEEHQEVLRTLYNHSKFCQVINTGHSELQGLLMEGLFIDSSKQRSKVTRFGSSDVKQFPLGDRDDAHFFRSQSPIIDVFSEQEILEGVELGVERKERLWPVKRLVSKVAFNSSLFRTTCRNMLGLTENLRDEDLMGDYRYVIQYIWEVNRWTWVPLFLFLELMTLFFYYLFVIAYPQKGWAYILTMIVSLIESILELMGAMKEEDYFLQLENYIDIVVYPGMIITSSVIFADFSALQRPFFNFVVTLLILLSGLRAMNVLSLFKQTRYLNSMILSVFKDIIGFTFITILFVFFFAVGGINMFHLSTDPKKEFRGLNWSGVSDLAHEMNEYYNNLFASWDDLEVTNAYDGYRFTIYIITSVFLAFILANLVIAMISKTFEDFQEDKELIDTKLMVKLLKEHGTILSYFEFKGEKEMSEADRAGMRHLVVVKHYEDEEEDDKFEELSKKVDDVQLKNESIEKTLKDVLGAIYRVEENQRKLASTI